LIPTITPPTAEPAADAAAAGTDAPAPAAGATPAS